MKKKRDTRAVTGEVRLVYPNLWEPKAFRPGNTPKYTCMLLIPKSDTKTVADINNAIDAAIKNGAAKLEYETDRSELNIPLKDGDLVQDEAMYKGNWYMNCSSVTAPQVVDKDLHPITNHSEIYGGIYGRVSINFFPYKVTSNAGIGAGLGNVMKTRDGERLGGVSAKDDFRSPNTSNAYDDFLG